MNAGAEEMQFDAGLLPAEGEYVILEAGETSWVVAMVEGRPFAFRNRCGHIPQRMEGGQLERGIWRCPHHGIRYDIATGEVIDDRGFNFIESLEVVACELRDSLLIIQPGIPPGE